MLPYNIMLNKHAYYDSNFFQSDIIKMKHVHSERDTTTIHACIFAASIYEYTYSWLTLTVYEYAEHNNANNAYNASCKMTKLIP